MTTIRTVCALVCALVFAALLIYGLKMFQQNSYRPERFLRWMAANPLPRFFARTKIRLAMTRRAWRLLCTSLLIGAAIFVFAPVWAAPVAALGAYFILLAAWLMLEPLEKLIGRWYYNDAARILAGHPGLKIIGVTGSFGKTSTKNYLYRLLSEKYNVLMTPGNFNTTLGVIRTIREHLKPYHEVFIVEMGAKRTGDIKEICDLVHPSVGVITAVGEMHLETFGSFENIQSTKFELVRSLPQDGLGVVNMDSPGIASYDCKADCRIESFGIDAHRCTWRAGNLFYSPQGTEFDLLGPGTGIHISTELVGEGNILDLTAALVVAVRLGVPEKKLCSACTRIRSVEHRLSISRKGGITVLDDAYNSNPAGAAMALKVLGQMILPEGARRIVVTPGFVELGPKQYEACRELGERASQVADILVVVNKINRAAILEGAAQGCEVIVADSLSGATAVLGPKLRAGDAVLYENDLPDCFA